MPNSKINSLTGMRFIAIMIIVISHFEFLKEYLHFGNFYWQYIHNPVLGVDFFFVLSGFGMMYSDINKKGYFTYSDTNLKSLIQYGINHVKKIYPLYLSTMAVMIPITVWLSYNSGKSVFTIAKICFLKILASLLMVQSAFGLVWLSHAFNGVCWFLSCLFCIYLVSPIYIKYLKKFCINIKRTVLLLFTLPVLAAIIAFLFKQVQKVTFFDDFVYGTPYIRIFYVLFGMVLAIFISKYKNQLIIKNINFFEIMICTICILYFLYRSAVLFLVPYNSLIYIIDIGIVGLVILFLAYNSGIISKLLSKPNMVYLGELSMYIFLIHYPIRIYIGEICKELNFVQWYVPIIMIITILTSTYYISKYLYTRKNQNCDIANSSN